MIKVIGLQKFEGCYAPIDDAEHVTQCPQEAAREVYKGSMLKVHKWMRDDKTDEALREAI